MSSSLMYVCCRHVFRHTHTHSALSLPHPHYEHAHMVTLTHAQGEVLKMLGHQYVDVLKFDIEGSEWDLFNDILKEPAKAPKQLLFELHTEGANRNFVPPSTVGGKSKPQVNELFIKLHDIGYRVVSKRLNRGDPNCADFTLIMVAN